MNVLYRVTYPASEIYKAIDAFISKDAPKRAEHSRIVQFIILLACSGVFLLPAQPVFAQKYVVYQHYGFSSDAGATASFATKRNNDSQTVGAYVVAGGNERPVLVNDSAGNIDCTDEVIPLPLLSVDNNSVSITGVSGVALNIERALGQSGNDQALIVGTITDSDSKKHAVSWFYTVPYCGEVWQNYAYTLALPPGISVTGSEALGTNGSDSVGYYSTVDGSTHAILFSGPVSLDLLSGSGVAYAINNKNNKGDGSL